MSIENDLGRIANALEEIVVLLAMKKIERPLPVVDQTGQVIPKTKVTKKDTVKTETPTSPQQASVSKDQLVDALRDVVLKKNPTVAKEVLGKFSAGRISEVKIEDYVACYKALQEVANAV